MARLSRKDTQQQTRERLLESALHEVSSQGIEAASIRRIAEAAGYTLGAFYSNFASKNDMLAALLERHTDRQSQAHRELQKATMGVNLDSALDRVSRFLEGQLCNQETFVLDLEFQLYANRDIAFMKIFERQHQRLLAVLAEVLEDFFRRRQLQPRIAPAQMALALSAIWCGFAVQGKLASSDAARQVILSYLKVVLDGATLASPTETKKKATARKTGKPAQARRKSA